MLWFCNLFSGFNVELLNDSPVDEQEDGRPGDEDEHSDDVAVPFKM
jgi:hypothetical protein